MGYEAMREQTLARQKEMGIVPADTELPPINPIGTPETRTGPDGKPFPPLDVTRPWDSLSADEKRLFARMAEVYAGFLAHADHQIGRLLDYLEESGQRENTHGDPGVRQRRQRRGRPERVGQRDTSSLNGIPDDIAGEPGDARRARRDRRPTTTTRTAGRWRSTRRSRCGSGTSSTAAPPTRASSPGPSATARPAARSAHQYHHAIDIVPTILDVLGVEAPETIKGHVQSRFDGVSMRYSFDDPSAPSARKTQFYSMLGSRGIWHDGWKAVTTHPTLSGWSHFNDDTWELYHTDVDRSELHDLAAEHPEKLRELVNLWFAEAGANDAFPLDDRSALEIILTPRPQLASPRDRYVYFPDTAEVPESQAVNIRNRSFTIGALVDIPAPGAQGVLFAHGSPVRRPRPVREGQPAALRLQLRRHDRAEGRRRPRTCRPGRT